MFNEKVSFENIPRQILWDNGNIIQPVLVYYELQRLSIVNAKGFFAKTLTIMELKINYSK